MASAAATWLQFAKCSATALAGGGGDGLGAAATALPADLATAADGVAAAGLGPLVSQQLLAAATAALQARLEHLHATLSQLCNETAGGADSSDDEEEEEEEEGADDEPAGSFTPEMEAALAEALRDACSAVESSAALLGQLCERVLRAQAALGPADRAALLAAAPRFRRHASTEVVGQQGGAAWAALLHRYYRSKLRQLSRVAAARLEAGEEEGDGMVEGEAEWGRDGGSCGGLGMEPGWARSLQDVAAYLRLLGLEDISEEAFAAVVCAHLRRRLVARAARAADERMLAAALAYSTSTPLRFLQRVLPQGVAGEAALAAWRARLGYYVYEAVGALRIDRLFDLVVDWPDSLPALEDLKECLSNTSLHRRLVASFRRALVDRLLHPGAATADIIQQYVSAIRALEKLDPGGALLPPVAAPVRAYLRQRRDAIRCIVTMLTADEEEGGDGAGASLHAELGNTEGTGEAYDSDFEGAEADVAALREAERWEPETVDADPSPAPGGASEGGAAGGGDVIAQLVGIYGSKELFINEYRSMLADRLLAKGGYECDRELRTLELLKLRFGEASLHGAEVMLKDLADSKRVNANVQSVPNTATPLRRRRSLVDIGCLSATIVSQLFWPQLQTEEFTPPPEVASMLSTYAAKYRSLKAPRKLVWRPALGSVSLDLFIGDQEKEFTVSPLHASILMAFQHRPEWPAAELAERFGVPPDVLRRKIVFWINQGVLGESRAAGQPLPTYHRNETLQSGPAAGGGEQEGLMEMEEGGAKDEHADMAGYEPFIVGMLTNFDALPLDRIHNMLKMFANDPPYDKSLEQLGAYLSALVAEERLSCEGGLYRKRS
ncbi:anaphase-promoting complex subunit 2 [Micractinium conductrix]|uniref:Anaphase-promoting complex subunit 2 n=1 Tax=Micractinium conductrix TaxID=554055 RepID=A0A2P6VS74_9CHLO|nr:anaphase-promoting complex subunit 2 [Micractinium conductrix]|eukprot:PSC76910.1 anaphase-promoting complex subunit 2 [Micractinium conductrix]